MARMKLLLMQYDKEAGTYEKAQPIMTIKKFRDEYHPGLKLQNFTYLFATDKLDYFELGNNKYIVMTDKTLAYTPSNNTKRDDLDKVDNTQSAPSVKPKKAKSKSTTKASKGNSRSTLSL